MKNYTVSTVDEYIASAPTEAQPKLRALRTLVKTMVPEVEESISWGIPFYKYYGALTGFAPYKNHISFGLGGPYLSNNTREDLEKRGYKTGSKTIQIRFDQDIPEVITEIIKNQAALNEAKATKR